jgi:DNA excision repair protein ERCC-4
MVKVYVDERERRSEVPRYLSELGVTVIFKTLEVGDYLLAEGVIAERKSVGDLAKSVFDGRFFDQLTRMAQVADRYFLIVEGDLDRLRYVTTRYRAVISALYYASVASRVPVLFTEDQQHTAELIKYLATKFQEGMPVPTHTAVARSKPKGMSLSDWQLYVVSSLPGVGPKLAERLLRKFGSVRAVFNASIVELASVEGLSESRASFIYRVINEPYVRRRSKSLEEYLVGGGSEESKEVGEEKP